MTIHETRCDACDRRFQAVDVPVLEAAQDYGWHVDDIVLCPGCVAASVEPAASYGQHHRGDDQQSGAEFWTTDCEYVHSYQSHRFGFVHGLARHRLTEDRLLDVQGLAATLDVGTLRRAVNIRAARAVAR